MQGVISSYYANDRTGLIRNCSGALYSFEDSDWVSDSGIKPEQGMPVIFQASVHANPYGRARKITLAT